MAPKDRIIENKLCAIEFLKARIAEEEIKEHNWHYELENCLWYLQKDNKCEKCVYGNTKKNKSFMNAGAAQCLRCSENYDLMFDEQ